MRFDSCYTGYKAKYFKIRPWSAVITTSLRFSAWLQAFKSLTTKLSSRRCRLSADKEIQIFQYRHSTNKCRKKCIGIRYIKGKRRMNEVSGWLAGRVCVHVARRRWAVAMQRGRFLWGPFWGQRNLRYILLLLYSGGVFFGVRSGSITWQRHLLFFGTMLANASSKLLRACLLFFGVCSGAVAWQRQ
jgi:hypothetical protein